LGFDVISRRRVISFYKIIQSRRPFEFYEASCGVLRRRSSEVDKDGDENTKDDGDKSDEDLSLLEDAPVFSEIDIVLGQDDSLFPLTEKV
jgi:hypothetical protein